MGSFLFCCYRVHLNRVMYINFTHRFPCTHQGYAIPNITSFARLKVVKLKADRIEMTCANDALQCLQRPVEVQRVLNDTDMMCAEVYILSVVKAGCSNGTNLDIDIH